MKLYGIVILVLSFTAAGFFAANEYLSVLKGITRVDSFLENMILHLKSEHMSIADIFEIIQRTGDEETKNFASKITPEDFSNADKTAFECGFCKHSEAAQILKKALFIFGRYSSEEQISELEHCRKRLCSVYEKNEDLLKNKAAFSRKAGFLAGLFIAVILF